MIAWSTLEDAVRAWALAASGLAADQVYFANQDVRRSEAAPRVIITLGDLVTIGVDSLTHDYSAARPAGQEIEYTARGPRELAVSLQAFAPLTVGSGVTARSLLDLCQAKLRLPSVRDALNAAGIGVLDPGTVRRLPQVVAGKWEDAAFLDVRCLVGQSVTERTGYIATVPFTMDVSPDGDA